MSLQTSRDMDTLIYCSITNVETGNGILSNYHLGMGAQQRRQQIKWWQWMWSVNWSTNLHDVANGGHCFSLKLENLNPLNTWRPIITFHNFLRMTEMVKTEIPIDPAISNIFVGPCCHQLPHLFYMMFLILNWLQFPLHSHSSVKLYTVNWQLCVWNKATIIA